MKIIIFMKKSTVRDIKCNGKDKCTDLIIYLYYI